MLIQREKAVVISSVVREIEEDFQIVLQSYYGRGNDALVEEDTMDFIILLPLD